MTAAAYAAILHEARLKKVAVDKLTARAPSLSVEQAYQIQEAGVELRKKEGEAPIGFKMGLTSEAKQTQMHVHSVIWGVLTDKMERRNGSKLLLAEWIHPKIELEVAFRVGRDLKGEVSREEALAACSGIYAAFDVIDSRYRNFQFTLPDVIADNCSAAAFVLGPTMHPSDVRNLTVSLSINGHIVKTGNTNNISGDPVVSLIEQVRMLAKKHQVLKAGSIVLAGSAIEAVSLQPGMNIAAHIQNLGNISVHT